jgi:hypothetical protein
LLKNEKIVKFFPKVRDLRKDFPITIQ